MKKLFFVIVMMACFVSQMNAQIKFGIKGGLNFDKPSSAKSAILKPESAVGWQAGAMLLLKIPVIGIAVQPELLYSVKNSSIAGDTHGISYFEIPVNLQWGLDLLIVRPFVMAGPYFGFPVGTSGLNTDALKQDWGIGVGGGIDVWKLQVTARYALGLMEVNNVSSGINSLKNRTFTVSAGYFF
jgi:hypothetical protein